MAAKPLPDAEYLRQCFDYDPDTGVLTWRKRPREHFSSDLQWRLMNGLAGRPAGTPRKRLIGINYQVCLYHRVIWKLVTGEEPPPEIDHIDQDFRNNRWNNLRAATRQQQQFNVSVRADSRTGLKGVGITRSGRYYARLSLRGVPTRLPGSYETAEAAHMAYCEAARAEYGEFWSAGSPHSRKRKPTG